MTPLALIVGLGCVPLGTGSSDALVLWSGTVLDDPYLGEDPSALEGGAVVAVNLDDEDVAVGVESEGSAGSFSIEVPPGLELAMRISGPEHAPTVFRGRAPEARGLWFNGSLFARQSAPLDAFLAALELPGGGVPSDLSDGAIAHLWVEPAEPEALAGASFALVDGAGEPGTLLAFTTTETGALEPADSEDPITLILGVDLAPGNVTLGMDSLDGRSAETTWPARGGDLLAGPLFALSAE